MNMLITAW